MSRSIKIDANKSVTLALHPFGMSNANNSHAFNILGAAYAELGQFNKAIPRSTVMGYQSHHHTESQPPVFNSIRVRVFIISSSHNGMHAYGQ